MVKLNKFGRFLTYFKFAAIHEPNVKNAKKNFII